MPPWVKTCVFAFEVVFVVGLLVWWLTSAPLRESKSLWVLFLYCFPAEFIIATVPHEPVLLYFAKFYSPLTVALVSVAGTLLTEVLNYTVFKYMADLKVFRKMLASRTVQKTVHLFNKAPFTALWVAGFTPIPFYPFRFLVVIARYPFAKYLLAVLTSRAPRMYLIALAARAIRIPGLPDPRHHGCPYRRRERPHPEEALQAAAARRRGRRGLPVPLTGRGRDAIMDVFTRS